MLYKKLKTYKNVLWDWNGTLVKDERVSNKILKSQLQRHGLEVPSHKTIQELFCFPIQEFYKRLGFDFKKIDFETLNKEFFDSYNENINEIELFPDTKKILHELNEKGVNQFVISASEKNHLNKALIRHDILKYFKAIYGLEDTRGDSKEALAKKLITEQNLDPKHTILVGDTDHDLQVGLTIGVRVLLIAEGYQSYTKLSSLHNNVMKTRSATI